MTGDYYEHDLETQPISFASADYSAILFAPQDYRPRHVLGPVIYEDEISTLPARQGWDRDFDGGSSSSLIYLRADGEGQLLRVIKEDPLGSLWVIVLYDQDTQENLWHSDLIVNAYDAFWLADALVCGEKSPDEIDEILRWTIPLPDFSG